MLLNTTVTDAKTGKIHPSLAALAVDIASLTPDPKNARLHDERNLGEVTKSFREHGQLKPIVVQRVSDDGTPMVVRAGNASRMAALELGWTQIAAVVIDVKDREAIAYAIRDNRTAELAEWDLRVLAQDIQFLRAEGVDPKEVGWEAWESEPLLAASWDPPTPTDENFEVPDRKHNVTFSSEQWDALKAKIGKEKPTAENIIARMS